MRFSKMDSLQAAQLDFVPRERRGQINRVIVAFVLSAVIVFAAAYLPGLTAAAPYAPILAVVFMAILCLVTVYGLQIAQDLTMAAEFQNMLFSQALSVGSSFCMIVQRDGTIVHASDGFSDIFPKFDYAASQALEGVFEQGTVRKADRERIMGAIYSGAQERLIFPVITKYEDKKDYIITVEPLARPAGFCLIRGREYHGQRAGLQMLPDMLRTTSVDKIDHLLASSTTGHFTTDQYGRIEYVNPAFEQLLGYGAGEIVESKLALHHLFFSLGQQAVTEESPLTDYTGPAMLVTKSSGQRAAFLRQSALRDSSGKAIGATGSVVPA